MKSMPMKRWLIASLVLNLFLAGGIAGGAWQWWKAEHAAAVTSPTAATPARGLRYAADELSAEQRRAFRVGLRDARKDAGPSIQAARDSRQEVLKLLQAPQLDRNAILQALARTREADTAVRTRVETSVVEFASTLSPDDRRKFADGLSRRSALVPSTAAATRPASTSAKP